ncbi:MAG: bi-domain-containing oxidoreductase [Armatimonadetes bacterium]|nr:bi-domain-containing oxidoreductase [Candidatus Hippobium faecium]
MKQLFLMVNDGSVRLIDTPRPTVKENFVIAETEYSVVSAGTERGLASFGSKNLISKALERPDQVKKVFEKISTDGLLSAMEAAFGKLKEPMQMGYSAVGVVKECGKGVTEVSVGDRIAMVGQAYHSEVNRVNKNLICKIPETDKDIKQYSFCALGGIALQGIRQAGVTPGETVAVIGLGLLGHILSRILTAYGCDVIAYDIKDKTLPDTKLKAFINSEDENAVNLTQSLTKGRGADKVIITAAADSNAPMDLAAEIVRDRGTVCMIGVTRMNIDRRPYYKKEITFTIARSYGPGRYQADYEEKGVDIPIGYVRWTEGRNVEEFVRLISSGRLSLSDLITHTFPFEKAPEAYELITKNRKKERYIGVILEYPQNEDKWHSSLVFGNREKLDRDRINLGLIGAGSFASGVILPTMEKTGLFNFVSLASTGGVGAAQVSDRFSFQTVTNDYANIINDPNIDLVAVSTGHNTHKKFITEALAAGKNVYCEKPLCISTEELDEIEKVYGESKGQLFVGLNRRFSPLIEDIKKKLSTDRIPAVYNYVVNAGFIPGDHWTQDENVGGGRIIGECCHFADTIQFLDGSLLKSTDIKFAENEAFPNKDNAVITLTFESGAVGNIIYTSMGSKKFPKELLTVFSSGMVAKLNNYLSLEYFGEGQKKTVKLKQDKGIGAEYVYISHVLKGRKENSAIKDAFVSHRLLLEALGK